jgi:hypothetical protein
MCILPNFTPHDLTELKQNRKKETKKAEAVTLSPSLAPVEFGKHRRIKDEVHYQERKKQRAQH